MTINELATEAHAIAREKGWYDGPPRSVPELIALMHSELSEALEAYREGDGVPLAEIEASGNGKPEGFAVELADTIIRIADAAAYLGIDLEAAIVAKMRYNRTRPRRHGGKLA